MVSGNQGRLRNGFLFIGNWKAVKTFKMRYIVNFVFQNHHLSNMRTGLQLGTLMEEEENDCVVRRRRGRGSCEVNRGCGGGRHLRVAVFASLLVVQVLSLPK